MKQITKLKFPYAPCIFYIFLNIKTHTMPTLSLFRRVFDGEMSRPPFLFFGRSDGLPELLLHDALPGVPVVELSASFCDVDSSKYPVC